MMKRLICFFSLLNPLSIGMVSAKEWAFDVYLDKSKIGTHSFVFNNQQLTSAAKFNVKILFVNAYQYQHKAVEQWQDNCLVSLQANTTENKVMSEIKGKKSDSAFEVSDGKQSQNLPACTMTFAYWNPKILEQKQLLNPQNAEYLDADIKKIGLEEIVVKGKKLSATHYRLNGAHQGKIKLKIDLWYNENNDWVALKSTTPEGYQIDYRLK